MEESLYLFPQSPWEMACALFAAKRMMDALSELEPYWHPKLEADFEPSPNPLPERTEVRNILSILNAYTQKPQPPWGITMLGWRTYANHWSPLVRAAVKRHPYAFVEISYTPLRMQILEAAE